MSYIYVYTYVRVYICKCNKNLMNEVTYNENPAVRFKGNLPWKLREMLALLSPKLLKALQR